MRGLIIACLLAVIMAAALAQEGRAEVLVEVFSDTLAVDGKYTYAYPGKSSITVDTTDAYMGKTCLKITLDPTTYSGAAIGTYPLTDLIEARTSGMVEFWIKGQKGGEVCELTLIDADDHDSTKCEVGVMITPNYATITNDWQKVSVPLAAFKDQGQYWDEAANSVKEDTFDWEELKEVKINIRPYDKNESFTVYVDEIKITD